MNLRSRYSLIIGAILICLIDAAVLLVVLPKFTGDVSPLYGLNSYPDGYDQIATNLVEGHGYRFYPDTARTLMREPGYPFFLAGLFLVFGFGFTAVKVANMALGVGAAWLMTCIARKLSNSKLLIFGSPLLFLFHPGTLIAESRGGIEVIFTFLITLFMLTLYKAIKGNRGLDYVVSGGVLGLAVLVKSTPLLFPLVVLAYLLIFERQRIPKLAMCWNVALMVIAMFVVLSPWILRNYFLVGKFVPTASVLGVSAHAGQYICSHLSSDKRWLDLDRAAARERSKRARELGYPFQDGYYQYFYSSDDEVKFSSYLLRGVIAEYQNSPMLFIRCVRSNLFNFWFAGKTWKSTTVNLVVQLPLLLLALVGTGLSIRNKKLKPIAPMILLILYVTAVCLPILAQARYSIPLIPFLSLLACFALVAVQRSAANLWSKLYMIGADDDRSGKRTIVARSDSNEMEMQ